MKTDGFMNARTVSLVKSVEPKDFLAPIDAEVEPIRCDHCLPIRHLSRVGLRAGHNTCNYCDSLGKTISWTISQTRGNIQEDYVWWKCDYKPQRQSDDPALVVKRITSDRLWVQVAQRPL